MEAIQLPGVPLPPPPAPPVPGQGPAPEVDEIPRPGAYRLESARHRAEVDAMVKILESQPKITKSTDHNRLLLYISYEQLIRAFEGHKIGRIEMTPFTILQLMKVVVLYRGTLAERELNTMWRRLAAKAIQKACLATSPNVTLTADPLCQIKRPPPVRFQPWSGHM
jgi:hypothetical protein